MRRRYPEAPVTAVGALVVDDNRVLMAMRLNPPYAGQWSIPGGVQEVGETLVEAVHREVREETGLSLTDLHLLDVGDLLESDKQGQVEYHYVIAYYRCHSLTGMPRGGDDVGEVRWFTVEEVAALDISARLKRLVRRALEYEAGEKESKSQIF